MQDVEIKNMEGAAFFHVCRQENQRFLALRALTAGLHQLIDLLQKTT